MEDYFKIVIFKKKDRDEILSLHHFDGHPPKGMKLYPDIAKVKPAAGSRIFRLSVKWCKKLIVKSCVR